MRLLTPFVCAVVVVSSGVVAAQAPAKLALPDSPKIAFVGNTFVERDWQHGYLETRLILAFPEKDLVFRNLGWSGDNLKGESRAGFGTPADGFKHLERHVAELKPNVVLLNYGLSEAFAGQAGLDAFNSDLAKMLDMLAAKADKPQVVILGIMKQEKLPPPLPDPAQQNENIKLYNAALAKAAADRGHAFVDVYDIPDLFAQANAGQTFTVNGIHPTPAGFAFAAEQIAKRLGLPDVKWDDKSEKIRQVTLAKNELYFHRWRPQNETYIFGFRKREQGRNAVEIPQFDPLVAQKEAEINQLKK